jgi:C-terminal processing protease CtpA/Prc
VVPVVAYAKSGSLAGRASPEKLFGPSRYQYQEGANRLPLVVLVDAWTASASEEFAEVLQDHHAAIIVGAATAGAGCGFTNGGIPTELPRSHARVHIPDCARFRADGSNAVAGVTPDVLLPLLERDSRYQRAAKIAAGLQAARRTVGVPATRQP